MCSVEPPCAGGHGEGGLPQAVQQVAGGQVITTTYLICLQLLQKFSVLELSP